MEHKTALDISANRKAPIYSKREMGLRILWEIGKHFMRFSPRTFFGWRRFVLRLFGARIGSEVHIYNSAVIYMPWNLDIDDWSSIGENAFVYNLGHISMGKCVTVSHGAHLCAGTHDYTHSDMPLIKPPIRIEDNAWICADAFVGPNVTVGEGAVVGARAVAVRDVDPWSVVAGNPARFVKKRVLQSSGSGPHATKQ